MFLISSLMQHCTWSLLFPLSEVLIRQLDIALQIGVAPFSTACKIACRALSCQPQLLNPVLLLQEEAGRLCNAPLCSTTQSLPSDYHGSRLAT
jgi:hypothetical protein